MNLNEFKGKQPDHIAPMELWRRSAEGAADAAGSDAAEGATAEGAACEVSPLRPSVAVCVLVCSGCVLVCSGCVLVCSRCVLGVFWSV